MDTVQNPTNGDIYTLLLKVRNLILSNGIRQGNNEKE